MRKLITLTLLTSLLFSIIGNSIALAETNVTHLTKGTPAPYTGLLFTEPHARLVANQLKDYDRVKLLNKSLESSIELYKKNEELYQTQVQDLTVQNQNLVKAVKTEKSNSQFEKIIYFALGMVATGLVVYVSRQ